MEQVVSGPRCGSGETLRREVHENTDRTRRGGYDRDPSRRPLRKRARAAARAFTVPGNGMCRPIAVLKCGGSRVIITRAPTATGGTIGGTTNVIARTASISTSKR